jgi:tetratricopeptide (TPR) repeat protein
MVAVMPVAPRHKHQEEVERPLPEGAMVAFEQGYLCFARKEYVAAGYFFRAAAELAPDFSEAYFNLGMSLMGALEVGNAAPAFRKAATLNPEFVVAYDALRETSRVDSFGLKLVSPDFFDPPVALEEYAGRLLLYDEDLRAALAKCFADERQPSATVVSDPPNLPQPQADDITEEAWNEIKLQTLKRIADAMFDPPEHHLAYVRERISAGNVGPA